MSIPTLADAERLLNGLVRRSKSAPLTFPRRVIIDSARLELQVARDDGGLDCPFVTVAIDMETKRVISFVVGFEAPTAETVDRCIRAALASRKPRGTRRRADALSTRERPGR